MPESTFRELADNAPVLIWRSDTAKLCDWFNKPWLDFTGRMMDQEIGYGWADGVHPDDFERCVAIYTSSFDARQKFSMTYRLRRHDGAWRWLLDNGAPYNRDGAFAGYFGTCVDVTEQREEHDSLIASLAERDALLSEVYHRVKNNLQQIEGLIAIESAALDSDSGRQALKALSGRIRAMGAVHHQLMRSGNYSDVCVRDFITDLCSEIARGHGADERGVSLDVQCESSDVNIETAVILGLLVNELVTNAFKHGFPDGRRGGVVVSYASRGPDGTLLEVRDDGVGIGSNHPSKAGAGHSGYRLIEGFVDQLNGELSINSANGTRIEVKLP